MAVYTLACAEIITQYFPNWDNNVKIAYAVLRGSRHWCLWPLAIKQNIWVLLQTRANSACYVRTK
jgi:hypothetical protein